MTRSPSPSPPDGGLDAARSFEVSALAIASHHADAVGTLRLSCRPAALGIELLRVQRYGLGLALLGNAQPVRLELPYTAVRGLVRSGPLLQLALDARVAVPYRRFVLCCFSEAPHEALLGALRARAAARLVARLAPWPLGGLAAWATPAALATGLMGRGAVALLAAAVAWVALGRLARWLASGGPVSDQLRDRFEQVLSHYLALEPSAPAPRVEAGGGEPLALSAALRTAWGAVGRPRALALVCAAAVVSGLAALAVVQRYGIVPVVVMPVREGRAGMAAPVRSLGAEARATTDARHAPCHCERPSSWLWDDGLPVLSIVLAPRRGGIERVWVAPGETVPIAAADPRAPPPADEPDRQRRSRHRRSAAARPGQVELDVAVVNNGALPLDGVSMVLTFATRTETGERTRIRERGLAWEPPLAPGGTVKWRVEAEGNELRVDCRLADKLGAVPMAPVEALRGLGRARLPPVRLHGAMLLAYQREAGARAALEALTGLAPPAEAARQELLRLLEPLQICQLEQSERVAHACVFNQTPGLLRSVTVTELGAAQAAPARRWTITDLLRPGAGLRVELPLAGRPLSGGVGVRAGPDDGGAE